MDGAKAIDSQSPAWTPTPDVLAASNLTWLMQQAGVETYDELHAWSVKNREEYWRLAVERLGIKFKAPYTKIADFSQGAEYPQWLVSARYNIIDSCFSAPPDSPAIIFQTESSAAPSTVTVAELERLANKVASSLHASGFKTGDAIAIVMPMTVEAVAIYLGIIKAGCVVVGIADSFQAKELSTRFRLANTVAVFTHDITLRGGKALPLYANLIEAQAPKAIVLPARDTISLPLRSGDSAWADFLNGSEEFATVVRGPADTLNILFSSGTTGEPKADSLEPDHAAEVRGRCPFSSGRSPGRCGAVADQYRLDDGPVAHLREPSEPRDDRAVWRFDRRARIRKICSGRQSNHARRDPQPGQNVAAQ